MIREKGDRQMTGRAALLAGLPCAIARPALAYLPREPAALAGCGDDRENQLKDRIPESDYRDQRYDREGCLCGDGTRSARDANAPADDDNRAENC